MDEQNPTTDESNDTSNALPDPVIEDVVDHDQVAVETEEIDTADAHDAAPPRRSRFRSPVLVGVVAGILGLGIGAGAVAAIGGGDHNDHHRDGTQQMHGDQHMPGGHMDQDQDGN